MMPSVAWAQTNTAAAAEAPSTLLSLVPFIVIFVIFYFLLILPQQRRAKQQKAILAALKKGDKVITSSGIWGTITNLDNDTVTVQIADNAKVKIQRENIGRLRTTDEQ